MRPAATLRAFWRPGLAALAYLALAASPALWVAGLGALFPAERRLVYAQATMLDLVSQHLAMVAVSSVVSVIIGVSLGIFVTRPAGEDFFDVVSDLANLGQTFPPIAVLTLAVPLFGFGFRPTVLALIVYGVLPILQNTIGGIRSVPATIAESARAMGLTPWQVLTRVELRVAVPVIFAGIRISVIVNVSTATIGAAIGAGGLGVPIISGLVNDDPAVIVQGGLLAAGLALVLDGLLGAAEKVVGRSASARAALAPKPRA